MVKRLLNTQTVAWFYDLIRRGLVDLDPSYQRRSVWTKPYKRYFIDTIMRNFPSPPIFLDRRIDTSGNTRYAVVDGKQRLLSILEFIKGDIALPDDYGDARLDGKYFTELSPELKSKSCATHLLEMLGVQITCSHIHVQMLVSQSARSSLMIGY